MSEHSPSSVVCDAGPLIHLDELECLDLLSDFREILVPNRVWEEAVRHRPAALARKTPRIDRVIISEPVPPELEALNRLLGLHRGEQEALQAATQRKSCMLLTDDTAARLAARSLGLPVHGTIGVLIRAIRRKQKTKQEVIDLLGAIPNRTTLHIRAALLHDVIRQVEVS